MNRTLDTTEYLDTVAALLRGGATDVPVPIAGTSMAPFLRPGDTVYLNVPGGRPRPGDVVLFTRPGGQYVLHRIMGVRPDGTCLLQGDAQLFREPVPDPARILAVATAARRKGKRIGKHSLVWWFFRHPWRIFARWRPLFGKLARKRKSLRAPVSDA